MSTGEQPAPPWSSTQASEEILFWCWEQLVPFLDWPWCLQGCFSHFCTLLSFPDAVQHFLSFLKYVITDGYQFGWWGQLWTAEGQFWSQLELSMPNMLPLLTTQRGHPCRPLATKTLQHNSSTLSVKVVFCSNIQVSYKRKPYEFICTFSKL